ncbi:MAG: hypothetical protein AB7O62_10005 [Pirellulales bacterium]
MDETLRVQSPASRFRFAIRPLALLALLAVLVGLQIDWHAKRKAQSLHEELRQWLPPYVINADKTYFTPDSVYTIAGRQPDDEAELVEADYEVPRRHAVYAFRGALHYYTVHAFFEGPQAHLSDVSYTIDRTPLPADQGDGLP